MAKQTINIGASPNDGTGTPLRTAFDYCNLNFTELYTATGPSGNNIVVPGNATITGDLTVDTNVLKVDTTNDNVIVGATSAIGGGRFSVQADLSAKQAICAKNSAASYSATNNFIRFTNSTDATVGGITHPAVTSLGVWGVSDIQFLLSGAGTTAMTLNSTGLGVGRSPSYRFQASSGTKATTASIATVGGVTTTDSDDFGIFFRLKTDATATNRYAAISSFDNGSGNGPRDLVLQDLGGNVGIGVTPSAWGNLKVVQFSGGSSIGGGFNSNWIQANAYYDGADWRYIATAAATRLQHDNAFKFFTAPSGTAGNAITFTQAMTLDASGNLLVGVASNPNTARAYFRYDTLTTQPVINSASIVAASTSWNHFVGQSGNGSTVTTNNVFIRGNGDIVNANGVYGTISDLRLKENISDARNYLSDLLKLRVVKYSLKSESSPAANLIGLIAQEVEQVFPTLVETNGDDVKSIKTTVLIPMLLKALQELTARVQTLETR